MAFDISCWLKTLMIAQVVEMDSGKTLKPTVLSLSLLTIMSTSAVSPALGEIGDFFCFGRPEPCAACCGNACYRNYPIVVICQRAYQVLPEKNVLLSGLAIFTVAGVSGGLANNIHILLFTRILMGMGLGMVIPFSTALISDFFFGEGKATMMGLSSSFNMLGGMISLVLAGQLAFISWNLPFLIYAFGLPVLLLNAFSLPDLGKDPARKRGISLDPLPGKTFLLAFYMLLFCIVFFILTPTMAIFLSSNGLGGSRMAGISLACATLGGFAAGIILPRTRQIMGRFFVPAMLVLNGAGFILLWRSWALFMVFAGSIMIGLANRSVYPIFPLKATEVTTPVQSIRATSLLSAMIYLGQFMAPPFQHLVGAVFRRPDIPFLYLFVAALSMAASLPIFVHSLGKTARGENRQRSL